MTPPKPTGEPPRALPAGPFHFLPLNLNVQEVSP